MVCCDHKPTLHIIAQLNHRLTSTVCAERDNYSMSAIAISWKKQYINDICIIWHYLMKKLQKQHQWHIEHILVVTLTKFCEKLQSGDSISKHFNRRFLKTVISGLIWFSHWCLQLLNTDSNIADHASVVIYVNIIIQPAISTWASSFLTAHQHNIGYIHGKICVFTHTNTCHIAVNLHSQI